MVTFFTTFKKEDVSTRNALNSWLAVHEQTEIIVFSESGMATTSIVKHNRISYVNDFKKHENGLPLLNDLFEQASLRAKYDTLCYCNSDIILLPELTRKIQVLLPLKKYLAVSQRIDAEISFPIDFLSNESIKNLRTILLMDGKIHPPAGSDIFIFPRNQYDTESMPPLVVGRPGWDNWMLFDARLRFNKLIDIGRDSIDVIHQDHPGNYDSSRPADQVNFAFLPKKDKYTFVLSYANHIYQDNAIKRIKLSDHSLIRLRWERKFNRHSVESYYLALLILGSKMRNLLKTFYGNIKSICNRLARF